MIGDTKKEKRTKETPNDDNIDDYDDDNKKCKDFFIAWKIKKLEVLKEVKTFDTVLGDSFFYVIVVITVDTAFLLFLLVGVW